MSTNATKFSAGFTAGAVAAAFLNLLPFFRTRGTNNGDGFEIIGFPFTFRRLGGVAGIHEFHTVALISDIAAGLVLALLVGYIFLRALRRDQYQRPAS